MRFTFKRVASLALVVVSWSVETAAQTSNPVPSPQVTDSLPRAAALPAPVTNDVAGHPYGIHLSVDGSLAGRVEVFNAGGTAQPVQAQIAFIQKRQVIATVRSDEQGRFQAVGLRLGVYSVVGKSSDGWAAFSVRVDPFDADSPLEQRVLNVCLIPASETPSNAPAPAETAVTGKRASEIARLRQAPPAVHLLGPRDVVGIYVEGILGQVEQSPPFRFPDPVNTLPGMGYPLAIRDDGSLSLPLLPPLNVSGLTIPQLEHQVREEYTVNRKILPPDRARIIVTLMMPRTYSVLVVREDLADPAFRAVRAAKGGDVRPAEPTLAKKVSLPAYENDILHALAETGGLPARDGKHEIQVLRAGRVTTIPWPLGNEKIASAITEADITVLQDDVLVVTASNP